MAEKEYILGNKTKDLLVYTFTVTKPIGDKTMDISEVVKILRTIKELPDAEREAFILEVVDSMEKANSKQGFPKSAVYTYAKTIRETAVLILRNIAIFRLSMTGGSTSSTPRSRTATCS